MHESTERRWTALQIDFDFVCCSVIRLNADLRRWSKNAEQSSWTPRKGLALCGQKKWPSGHLQRTCAPSYLEECELSNCFCNTVATECIAAVAPH